MGEATWSRRSVVRGHHVWTPYVGQRLQLSCEENNDHDDHAVSVRKASGTVVGHAPREMSRTFWYFLRHEGEIEVPRDPTQPEIRGGTLTIPNVSDAKIKGGAVTRVGAL